MAFNYEYPYTDPNRYNSDWELNQIRQLQDAVNDLIERYKSYEELLSEAKGYTDEQISAVKNLIYENTSGLVALNNKLDSVKAELIIKMETADKELDSKIESRSLRLQQSIAQQWEDMKAYIADQVIDVKVRNFFTGQLTSIQAMFDYLAGFHLQDAGTYTQVSGINTYDYYIAKNESYSDVVISSRTFFNS